MNRRQLTVSCRHQADLQAHAGGMSIALHPAFFPAGLPRRFVWPCSDLPSLTMSSTVSLLSTHPDCDPSSRYDGPYRTHRPVSTPVLLAVVGAAVFCGTAMLRQTDSLGSQAFAVRTTSARPLVYNTQGGAVKVLQSSIRRAWTAAEGDADCTPFCTWVVVLWDA